MVIFRLKNVASSLFILLSGCFGFLTLSAPNSLAQTNSIGAATQPKVELVLGNPSGATADTSSDPNNFLIAHNGFILSYKDVREGMSDMT